MHKCEKIIKIIKLSNEILSIKHKLSVKQNIKNKYNFKFFKNFMKSDL